MGIFIQKQWIWLAVFYLAAAPSNQLPALDTSSALTVFFGLAASTFVSEDLTLLTAGALAGQGQINLLLAIAACFFGVFVGDLLLFFAGRFLGRAALKRAPLRWLISEAALDRGARWLERNGLTAILLSRVTPGLRLPVYFAAGVLKTNLSVLALYFALAAFIWTPVLVIATAWFSFGTVTQPASTRDFWLGILVVVGTVFILLNLILRLATWRGRRLLAGAWKRRTRWEFWSLRTFYLPIVVYIGWLAIKFRSLSVFADANPAIPAGGFVGESKAEIYEGLRQSAAAAPHLLRYELISQSLEIVEKLKIADEFMCENQLCFPVALKPNAGERGKGVFVVKSRDSLVKLLTASKLDLIIQEFAAGHEFSVFYYRYPKNPTGRIFAVTEKQFPFVIGDGRATLETLILRDKRAVALANAYFEINADRLDYIPATGEKVGLIEIGTHSKGAIFLDGNWVKTEILERKLDEICRGYAGFYFGRFDLRTGSIEGFKRGEDFKIIELNGVTSEATNIYDPKNSIFAAYRTLFKQWRIAFEIGAQNRELGRRSTSVRELLKLIFEHFFGTFQRRIKPSSVKEYPKCV